MYTDMLLKNTTPYITTQVSRPNHTQGGGGGGEGGVEVYTDMLLKNTTPYITTQVSRPNHTQGGGGGGGRRSVHRYVAEKHHTLHHYSGK